MVSWQEKLYRLFVFFSVNITVHRTVINKIAFKVKVGEGNLSRGKLTFKVQALYSYIYIYVDIYIYICMFFQNFLLGKLYQTHHCTMIKHYLYNLYSLEITE